MTVSLTHRTAIHAVTRLIEFVPSARVIIAGGLTPDVFGPKFGCQGVRVPCIVSAWTSCPELSTLELQQSLPKSGFDLLMQQLLQVAISWLTTENECTHVCLCMFSQ